MVAKQQNLEEVVEETAPTSFETALDAGSGTGQELVEVDETLPVRRTYDANPEFEQDEVMLPRLRVAQGLTPEVTQGTARPGDILVLGYEAEKSAVLIPVAFNRSRRRPDPVDRQAMPLCTSPDGRRGVGDPGVICADCACSKWTPQPGGGRNKPPECQLTYSYVAYSVTHETIVELSIRTTTKGAQDAAKKLNMFIQSIGMGKFGIEVSSLQSKNGGGQAFFVPQVMKVQISPEDLAVAASANPAQTASVAD